MTNMSFTERERAYGNAIFFSANRLQSVSYTHLNMNRRQRKKKKAQVFTIILGCTAFCKAEQYEKMRKSVEYQLRTGSVVMLPAYLHVEAIIKQRGGRNIEIKQENGVVNV